MRGLAAAAPILLAGTARAEDPYCRNGDFPSGQETFGLAKVAGPGRLHFLKDADGCPNEAPACGATA